VSNNFTKTREKAETSISEAQARNRSWWERLPMTYANWDAPHRLEPDDSDGLLRHNPFLRAFDFAVFDKKKVLDLGCGAGDAACLFCSKGARVTAADLTKTGVLLTAHNRERHHLLFSVVQTDAESMGFTSGSFDYVFSWGVLHHSANPTAAFKEVGRVLTPGGEGLLMVYNRASLRYFLKGLNWLVIKRKYREVGWSLPRVQQFFTDGYYHKHFTARELTSEMANAGLSVTNITVTHMAKRMVPIVPPFVDHLLKRTLGWLLVVSIRKENV